ncbi:hypothetical protein SAMN02745121_03914 [Nannocystis exedens]|uniref:Uncharacterized protein n=2 Tax=Nannocystis exedens TaxID=54 RepID=A0A1I1ZRT5_9BACT|nr:hypothetical protein NAEX_08470 [Nannocystis exedens]SFE34118.1 hypothetical protein SAMN02745121_03914 [Nannocystis exedens]
MPRFTYLSTLFMLSAALAPACTYPKVLGEAPLEGDTSSGTDTSSPGTDTAMPSTDGDPPGACGNPAFTCSQPVDCEQWDCGALASPFDADGCLRPTCTDSPCAADEICYSVEQPSECPVGVVACGDDPQTGECVCELSDACTTKHCIPADEGPPVECPAITDEAACLAAGCSEFAAGVPLYRLDEGQQCILDEIVPACLWFPGDSWGGPDAPGTFYDKATGRATQFGTDWVVPPHGWGDCDDPDAPPVCACVGQCIDLQAEGDHLLAIDKPCNDVSDCVLADAICYAGDTCGSVGVHKDNIDAWNALHAQLETSSCCDGAAACGSDLACENNRCVAVFPP